MCEAPTSLSPRESSFRLLGLWTPEYQPHREPLPGGWVHPRTVESMDTNEKTPWRYPLAFRFLCFLNTWTPESLCHRAPLPGGQVIVQEVQSLLTSVPEPHVRTWSYSSISNVEIQPGAVVPGKADIRYSRHFSLAAILFWMGCENLPYDWLSD